MRLRSKNRLRDGAAGDATDAAALAVASFDLPTTNIPSNAALGVPSLQALADPPLGSGELKAPADGDDGAADPNGGAADAALAGLPHTNNPSNAVLTDPSLQALADTPLGSGELKAPADDDDNDGAAGRNSNP